jgi:hypothetical protein
MEGPHYTPCGIPFIGSPPRTTNVYVSMHKFWWVWCPLLETISVVELLLILLSKLTDFYDKLTNWPTEQLTNKKKN